MTDLAGQGHGEVRGTRQGTAWRFAIIGSLSLAGIALLGPRAASAAAGGWDFDFVLYAWLTEVHGSVSARNRTAGIDIMLSSRFDGGPRYPAGWRVRP
jgi:hypothetical protein